MLIPKFLPSGGTYLPADTPLVPLDPSSTKRLNLLSPSLTDPRLPLLTRTTTVSGFLKSVSTLKIQRRQLSAKRGMLPLPPPLLANPFTTSMSHIKHWGTDAFWFATTDRQTLAISLATANSNQPPALLSRHSFNDYRPRGPSLLLLSLLLIVAYMTRTTLFQSCVLRANL